MQFVFIGPDDANDDARFATTEMDFVAQFFYPLDDCFNALMGSVLLHYDNHGFP
jgi:hypothetical protein